MDVRGLCRCIAKVGVELGQNSLEVSLHKPDHTSVMNIIIAYSIRWLLCRSIGSVVGLV